LNPTGSELVYSTYLGGSDNDFGQGIVVNAQGEAYVTGGTLSANFPTTKGVLQPQFAGNSSDAFVTKLNASGSGLVYSTFLGGSTSYQAAFIIAIDTFGNAYVAGSTNSTDFPVLNAFQSTYAGASDGFFSKLNTTGSALLYSTYLGGSDYEQAQGIAVDRMGNAYVAGYTQSADFPTTPGAFQRNHDRSFCDPIAGSLCADVFVTKIDTNSSGAQSLVYSTFLGGTGPEFGAIVTVDEMGNAYLTGITPALDFPVVRPIQAVAGGGGDAFVTVLNAAGSQLLFSTYLGGSCFDVGEFIALDPQGNIYVEGNTCSTDFPVTPGAYQTKNRGGYDVFVVKISPVAPVEDDLPGEK